MELENQVCSLELAKLLKGLGIEQQSLYCWGEVTKTGDWVVDTSGMVRQNLHYYSEDEYSAFTVAELGELLPKLGALLGGERWDLAIGYDTDENFSGFWEISYHNLGRGETLHIERADTEADARAKMLVYLLENGFIARPLSPQ